MSEQYDNPYDSLDIQTAYSVSAPVLAQGLRFMAANRFGSDLGVLLGRVANHVDATRYGRTQYHGDPVAARLYEAIYDGTVTTIEDVHRDPEFLDLVARVTTITGTEGAAS